MGINFAQPLALWGLLGLPVILAIHFLQSRNRREEVSTLFLLEMLAEETRRGAVFSYLRNGLQLWLQLLAVLLFTLLLARPMRLHRESVQSIALVLDHSVSMRAFQAEVAAMADGLIEQLDGSAARTEWWIMPSDTARADLARGADRNAALASLSTFDPLSGPHSFREALLRARQVTGPEGLVLYLSDHAMEDLPARAVSVSAGTPLPNSGISGVRFESAEGESMRWQVSVLHFGDTAVRRELTVELDGVSHGTRTLELNPGAITTVSGTLPLSESGEGRGVFRLDPDAYAWDDARPFVLPRSKPLRYRVDLESPRQQEWAERVMGTVPGAVPELFGDVVWWTASAEAPPPDAAELRFLRGSDTAPFARVTPGDHPLVRDLSWEGLLAQPFRGLEPGPGDEVLLWMGDLPLVLRPAGREALWFNFDAAKSNAERWPAVVLMLNRFLTQVQSGLPVQEALNLETRQPLGVIAERDQGLRAEFTPLGGEPEPMSRTNRAPDRPGYLRVWEGEQLRLRAGVGSGDSAEGNFQSARPKELPDDVSMELRKRNSETDFLLPPMFALLAGTLVAAWWSETRGGRR